MDFDYNEIMEGLKEFKECFKELDNMEGLKKYKLKDFKQAKAETKSISNLLIDYVFLKATLECTEKHKKEVSTADMLGYIVDAMEAMWSPF